MMRAMCCALLCLAAVGGLAGAQVVVLQPPYLEIHPATPNLGGFVPCALTLNAGAPGSSVYLFIGDQPGFTNIQVGTTQITIPVSGTVSQVTSQTVYGPAWKGAFSVPTKMTGTQTCWATALVIEPWGTMHVANVVPFGPIIEDSIQ